jgi:hypothetical protein
LALQAFIAILIDSSLENSKRGDQAEKSPQRTKITAPEARDKTIQENNSPEDQERDGSHIINRLKIMKVG